MISEETKRKLREQGMDELIEVLNDQEQNSNLYDSLTFDQRFDMAIDDYCNRKNASRTKRLLKAAKLRYKEADINTLYYEGRSIDKNTVLSLSTGNYFINPKSIVINGFAGCGKTHLACALGKQACRQLRRTCYIRMPDLLEKFNLAEQEGKGISSLVTRLSNYELLIIDEWLQELPSEREVRYFLELFEKRYDASPTIFCTQYKTSEWHPRLGGGVLADAICDRLIHGAEIINLGDFNMRKFLATHKI